MLHSFAVVKGCTAGVGRVSVLRGHRRHSQVLREGLLVQSSCGTVSLALLAAGDSLFVMFNMVQILSSFRMRHLPVVPCSLLGGIPMARGCKCLCASGCCGSCSPLPV